MKEESQYHSGNAEKSSVSHNLKHTGSRRFQLNDWWHKRVYSQSKSIDLYSIILFLLSVLYRIGSQTKKYFYVLLPFLRSSVKNPIIVVGNLTVGGSGKTPIILHLLERYYDHDKNLHLISRGYGSKFSGPFARYRSGVWDVQGFFGDEIELCIDRFPQVEASVGKRRALMVEEASRQNSKSIILMDDALQYWRLEKDFKIISVHGGLLFGNQRIFPSGPMREHPSNLQHANIIMIFNPIQSENFYRDWIGQFVQNPVPIFFIRTRLDCLVDREGKEYVHGSFEGISAVAACAIAHPEYFFRDLESNSMDLRDKYSFADHHQFTNSEEEMIINAVKRVGADFLVLTEKDKPRWRSSNLPILFARQSLKIANEEDFYLIIEEYVNKKRQ